VAPILQRNTKLVAISLVSYLNGFQYDLKAVLDLAHSRGAYVYADFCAEAATSQVAEKGLNGAETPTRMSVPLATCRPV
jgi:selenocysteine lyase/cysteine desulfurase